ncbi:MAG TPA: NYN domain-containing protein [Isosphaeraceae bacterium]|jgi:hypothetical protein|nr:NYN domain-containing protein [Isosphaeraceae bacterium]
MRILIDGYNLMYATGLLDRSLGPAGFRKVRKRFLNDLAASLDPVEAHQTTVVFDASAPCENLPTETSHRGLSVVFAVGDENADARIEWMIAHHSVPKSLTVVSSDHRVRQAATRRKAESITSEAFLDQVATRRHRRPKDEPAKLTPEEVEREHGLDPAEAAYWRHEFRDVVADPETKQQLGGEPSFLTDEEIAKIEREIENELH